jgi:hypothetical protein
MFLLLSAHSFSADTKVTINDFDFLVGYWEGTGFGGQSEEMWMPPRDGRMFGIFKQSSNSELQFSEFLEITSDGDSFVLRLRHFNSDFTAWEDKEEFVSFPFVSVADKKAVFEGLTYEITDNDELLVSLVLYSSDGSQRTEQFRFKRMSVE